MRVIAVSNQKGGVGKTTLVANLGAALAEQGRRVVLIDLDPQGALTASFGLDPYTLTRTAHLLLTHESVSLASVLRAINPQLVLVPAAPQLSELEHSPHHRPEALRQALLRSRVPADFVLIDTPPAFGPLTTNAFVAAEEVLAPVQCQYLAMRGVRGLLEFTQQVRTQLNPRLRLLGLVATLYKNGSVHAREVLDELRAVFGQQLFDAVIEDDETLAKAPVARKSVMAYAPHSPAAAAFRRLAQEIVHGQ